MKLAIFSLFLAVSTAVATTFNETAPKICGTEITPEEIAAAEAHFKEHKVPPSDKAVPVTIEVYFHVIRADNTTQGGNVPDVQINNAIRVLNSAFAPAAISFRLANITRTTNVDWFNNAGPNTGQQGIMKNLLHTGDSRTLNVYSVGLTKFTVPPILLGYATYPQFYASAPRDDGAVIRFSTVPGGTAVGYNMGITLVHEVGHWAGLLHTFEGACAGNGDEVADTPPERTPADGCPTGPPPRDTCPGGGVDPIHNYMDYSNDACRTQFTPGQIARMRQRINLYRNFPM